LVSNFQFAGSVLMGCPLVSVGGVEADADVTRDESGAQSLHVTNCHRESRAVTV